MKYWTTELTITYQHVNDLNTDKNLTKESLKYQQQQHLLKTISPRRSNITRMKKPFRLTKNTRRRLFTELITLFIIMHLYLIFVLYVTLLIYLLVFSTYPTWFLTLFVFLWIKLELIPVLGYPLLP